jgi:hypothetical protein
MVLSWWRRFTRRPQPRPAPGRRILPGLEAGTFSPHVETLEARTLLSFSAPTHFPGNIGLGALATGDFNHDGKLDLVGTNPSSNSVSVLLGKGDGTFQNAVNYSAGTSPQSLAVGDFLGNGKLDLAVVNAGGVSILLGKGDGTFSTSFQNFAAGTNPTSVAIGDFNGDGKLDLAVTNANGVSLLLGKGDGTFRPAGNFAVGFAPTSLTVSDFNHDGKPDLAVTGQVGGAGKVAVLFSNGNGTFQAPVTYTTSPSGAAQSVVAGDFNRDGTLDLAVSNNDSTVSILLGNPDGTFQKAVNQSAGRGPLVMADFNNDGKIDLAVAGTVSNQIGVLLGNGDGTFQTVAAASASATALAVGDFNNDHLPDLATNTATLLDIPIATQFSVTTSPTGTVTAGTPLSLTITAQDNFGNNATGYTGTVTLASSDGSATLPNTYTFTAADHGVHTFPSGVILWQPGLQTISASDQINTLFGQNALTVAPGNPPSGPNLSPLVSTVVGSRPVSLVVADFNGDGKPDLATANFGDPNHPGSGSLSILLGNGDGTFQPATTLNVGNAIPMALAVGDFNGDGKPDLALADLRAGTVTIFLNNGNGTFHPGASFVVGPFPFALAVGDFNGDHKADLAVAYSGPGLPQAGGTIALFLGKGDGTFTPGPTYDIGGEPTSLTAADLNGDGKLDLVATNAAGSNVSVLLGNGNGTFQTPVSYAVGASPISVRAGDLNGDGKLDLVVANANSSTLSVLLGNGNGTFKPAINYVVNEDPEAVTLGDLNGDGKLDLVVTANFDHPTGTVSVLLGNGDGTFQAPVDYNVGAGPVPVAVADLNGDGAADLVVGNAGHTSGPAASVSVLLGAGASQLQFNASAYTVQENAGTATITVTRTGDTSGAVSVRYSTSNGSATAGIDYTAASGILSFAPGETSKTFTVSIQDDAQVEGNETINLTLSHPTGGASLVTGPAQVVLTIHDNNDGTVNQRFVAQVYLDLLHRPVDPSGLAAWSSLLNKGFDRTQMVLSLETSPEFLGQEVQQIYAAYLGRAADPTGLSTFVTFLGHGGTVEQVKALVLGSAEYYNRAGGTNISLLSALYRDLLGRDIDPTGASAWSSVLNAGATPTAVAQALINTSEARSALVSGLYQRYLHRPADPTGLASFSSALARGMRDEQLIAYLVGSSEYFGQIS